MRDISDVLEHSLLLLATASTQTAEKNRLQLDGCTAAIRNNEQRVTGSVASLNTQLTQLRQQNDVIARSLEQTRASLTLTAAGLETWSAQSAARAAGLEQQLSTARTEAETRLSARFAAWQRSTKIVRTWLCGLSAACLAELVYTALK